jgi:hypothetical protein
MARQRKLPNALRAEDYVAFLDESGEPGLQVVAGVLIPARWLRSGEQRWKDFIRDRLGSRSGRTEIHSRELLRGEGVSLHAQAVSIGKTGQPISARAAGRQFHKDALEHIAGIAEVRILTVGLATERARDVYRLWFWLVYAELVARSRAPRPRLPMTIIDGEDVTFRQAHDLIAHRFYRSFPRAQPYVRRGRLWFVGGSAHQNSQLLPFIQMADLVAAAGRHAISKRKPYRNWYETHLRQHALSRNPPRDIDVAAHALAQLRRRSPKDACGSGYGAAILVP